MPPKITLYDIPTIFNYATSPNTWRVRLILNYKRLAFETVWLARPDIPKVSKEIGFAPTGVNPDGSAKYTLPAIIDRTHDKPIIISDSYPIVEYLEETYPDPPLFPAGTRAAQALIHHYAVTNLMPLANELTAYAKWQKQIEPSQSTFRMKQEKLYGKRLEEVCPPGPLRVTAWSRFKESLDRLDSFINKNGNGEESRFFLGKNISYGDLAIASILVSVKFSLDEEAINEFKTCSSGRWIELLEYCDQYIK